MTEQESPFACDMTVIAPDERGAHLDVIEALFRSVESVREIPTGYAFRLPNQSDVLLTVAQFITLERLSVLWVRCRDRARRRGNLAHSNRTRRR
jgi:hypothetical protein